MNLWTSWLNNKLTMNCDCDRCCGSTTILVEWNTAVAHWTSFLTDGSCMHCNITSSCGVKQSHAIPIKAKRSWWIGFCTASDVETWVYDSNVVCSQTRRQSGIFWTKVCHKKHMSYYPYKLMLMQISSSFLSYFECETMPGKELVCFHF